VRNSVKLDVRGLEEIAKSSRMGAAVREAAEAVADNVRGQGIRVGDRDGGSSEEDLPVVVYGPDDTNDMRLDRAQARVVLAHAAGDAVQAKHGALSKAATQAGLDFKSR
jgi:hypothetical protein